MPPARDESCPAVPAETVAAVLAHAGDRPARLGRTRLVCIDGPAGSGKTTLGAAIAAAAARVGTVALLHLDDLYEGWSGLAAVDRRVVAGVIAPLASGGSGRYRRYDWHEETFAEEHLVEPADWLILEGVGSGSTLVRPWRTTLVWVEAEADLRRRRGVDRDGPAVQAPWERWMRDEEAHFREHGTRSAADLRVDAVGRLSVPEPPPADTS